MIKFKCDVCSTEHGGFHLCLGRKVNVRAEQYEAGYTQTVPKVAQSVGKAAGAMARWEIHWAMHAERDQKILKMYMDEGASLQTVGEAFGLPKPTVKSIVLRLGGEMRPRNIRVS